MGKRKTKSGIPPPNGEYERFKDLPRRLVAVPRKEADEKMAQHKARRVESRANRDS